MSPSQILVEAYKRGRAWDPAYPNLLNLDEAAVAKMDGSEQDAQLLVKSLQESDINYDTLVLAFHERMPDYDGVIGPATEKLVAIPRCPLPDHAPPPNARFYYDDPDLQAAVESMQEAAASGSGSWPSSGCDPERRGMHSIRVRLNPAGMPATVRTYHEEALRHVVAAYADIGLSVRYLLDANSPAEITKVFQRLSGGTIGWNYFPRGGCTPITGVLSNSYAPSDGGKLWANLECHETGHGVGLQHTRGSIMNPSILLVWPLTWRGSPSESVLQRYFGGQPIPGRPKPDEPKPPPQPGPTADAEFTLGGVVYEIRKKGISPPPIVV
jgi:hypothetical protein